MKKVITLLGMVLLCVALVGCGNGGNGKEETQVGADRQTTESMPETQSTTITEDTTEQSTEEQTGGNILVVYFSVTGNTKAIAECIADGLPADIYEIVPQEPYTDADLNYNDNNSRSTLEMNDSSARPEINGTIDNFDRYDTIFIGYPIWWGEAPRILDTFVENYDFAGKTVVPFCTSGSSGIGSSADTLEQLAGNGNWVEGQRFSGTESADQVMEWAGQFKE